MSVLADILVGALKLDPGRASTLRKELAKLEGTVADVGSVVRRAGYITSGNMTLNPSGSTTFEEINFNDRGTIYGADSRAGGDPKIGVTGQFSIDGGSFTLGNGNERLIQKRSVEFSGSASIAVGVASELFRFTYVGASGGFSSLGIDLLVSGSSGGKGSTYRYRIAAARAGNSTLNAAVAEDGTRLQSTAGSHGTITVAVDVSTANTLIVTATGVSYPPEIGYLVRAVCEKQSDSLWRAENTGN